MKVASKQNRYLLLLIFCCLPLLFINVKSTHDWGDDYAQYLIQARNILEHRPQTDNGLVRDPEATVHYTVEAYPVGFPLMLSAVWRLTGFSITAFVILVTIFTFGFGVLIFLFLKEHFSPSLAFVLTLAGIYNPVFVEFKKEIISDIPFAFFFLASVIAYRSLKENVELKSRRWLYCILTGFLFGWSQSIRGIGVVLFLALAIEIIRDGWRLNKSNGEEQIKIAFQNSLLVFLSGLFFYFLLNSILFPIPSGNFFSFYKNAFDNANTWDMIKANSIYYYEVMKWVFNQGSGIWFSISSITRYIMVYGFIAGVLITAIKLCMSNNKKLQATNDRNNPGFEDIVFLLYFIVLLIYPYQAGGFRFWIPVIPFLFKYIGLSLVYVFNFIPFIRNASEKYNAIKSQLSEIMVTFFILIVAFQNINGISWIVGRQKDMEAGPQTPQAMQAIEYIKDALPSDAIIAFNKPRALTLYSEKKTIYPLRKSPEFLKHLFERTNTHYCLLGTEEDGLNDKPLIQFIDAYHDKLRIIWQNEKFKLYRF